MTYFKNGFILIPFYVIDHHELNLKCRYDAVATSPLEFQMKKHQFYNTSLI